MTVLVTGGTGVVGRPVIRMLVESGRTVRGLARSEESAGRLAELGATPVTGDIERPESLPEAMAGCEVVYHIAGLVSFCPSDPSALYRVNVESVRNVVHAARRAGVRRLIHTSSVAALGEKPGTVGDETTPHSGHYNSHYARSKHQGEQIALTEAGDMEVVVVNPASVQGAGRVVGSGGLLLQAVKGKLRFLVDSPISIVDAHDCARGHIAAEHHGVAGERYILSGFTISLRDAWNLLGELTGIHYPVTFVPKPVLTVLSPIGDLLGSRIRSFPVCRETIGLMRHGVRYDGSRAERELGLDYRTARETFSEVLDSFRKAGLIDI